MRNGTDKLHDQEDKERSSEVMRDNNRLKGRQPSQLGIHNVLRDNDNIAWQHHGTHYAGKPDGLALERNTSQPISNQSRGANRANGGKGCDKQGVLEEGGKGRAGEASPAGHIVVKLQPAGNKGISVGENFIIGLQGACNQPKDRIEHDNSQKAN
ncbi:hypothetical protein D3C81_1721580 [compost metagenome]